jgi:hypothetical protein
MLRSTRRHTRRSRLVALLAVTVSAVVLSTAWSGPAAAADPQAIAANPTSVDFGTVPVNTAVTRQVSITVDDGYAVGFATGSGLNPPFSFAFDNCAGPGGGFTGPGTCTIAETFRPTSAGTSTATLTIQECPVAGGACVGTDIALSGTGLLTLAANPTSVDFGTVLVGTTASRSVTITVDTGYAISVATGSGLNPPFAFSFDTCATGSGGFAGPGTCTVVESFSPTSVGAASGSIVVQECPTAGGSCLPVTIPLSGAGGQPAVGLSRTSVSFGDQGVSTRSAPMSVTLTNTGTTPLHVGDVTVSGPFGTTSDACAGTTVAPGGACTVGVAFAPTTAGAATGALTFQDDAADQPQVVTLSGTGVTPTAVVTPTSLDFGNRRVGKTSPSQTLTLVNTGTVGMVVRALSTTGDFSIAATGTCVAGLLVDPGDRCTVEVRFSPTATGTRHGSLVINDTASSSPQVVPLLGNGTRAATAPVFTVTPDHLTFGQQTVGTSSPGQTVVVRNTGTAPLVFTRIRFSGDFARSGGTCRVSTPVAAGGSCTVRVTFRPTAIGTRNGALTFADNAAGSPHSVALTGTGRR